MALRLTGSLFVELLPSALGLAITPTAIAVCILLLGSDKPVPNASAFAAGFAIVYGTLIVLALGFSHLVDDPLFSTRTKLLVSLVVGVVLLGLAAINFFRKPTDPPRLPKWRVGLRAIKPRGALVLGLLIGGANPNVPILIGALALVSGADLSFLGELTASFILLLASELAMVCLIVWYVVRHKTAAARFERIRRWMDSHDRVLNISVLLVFGAIFTIQGAAAFS